MTGSVRAAGWAVAAAALIGCASSKPSAARAPQSLEIPADLQQAVRLSQALGHQLYVLDKVSAIATDELLRHVPDPRSKNIAGYIPAQEADDGDHPRDSYAVTFFTRDEPPRLAYLVRVRPNLPPVLETYEPPRPATDSLARLVAARQAALRAAPPRGQPLNPVLLPGESPGVHGVLVYLLAGTKRPDTAVFGQHFRVLVRDDGSAPEVTPLSKSVLELPVRSPKGGRSQALMVTHLVTEYPLETHVLVSLQWRLPVYVATSRGLWRVEPDRVAFLGALHPDAAK